MTRAHNAELPVIQSVTMVHIRKTRTPNHLSLSGAHAQQNAFRGLDDAEMGCSLWHIPREAFVLCRTGSEGNRVVVTLVARLGPKRQVSRPRVVRQPRTARAFLEPISCVGRGTTQEPRFEEAKKIIQTFLRSGCPAAPLKKRKEAEVHDRLVYASCCSR